MHRGAQWVLGLLAVLVAGCGGGSSGSSSPANPPPVNLPPSVTPPSVTSLVPANTPAGGLNFVLTVNGTGFVASSVVQWNGIAKPTTFVNATALQAPIPAADIATGSTVSVTVFNPVEGTSAAASFVVSNPAPTVASVSPSFVPPGAPAFEVTVTGTGFVTGSVVRWNGADRPTTFVSATQLKATISAADVAAQAVAQVSVFNAAPGGGTSSTQAFFVGNPVPAISGLDPPIVRPGGTGLTLKVVGSLYLPTSIVSLNGVNAPTTFVSSTELQVAVSAADIASNGVIQVAAINPAPGGGASSFANLTVAPFGVTQRISVASDGTQANDDSDAPSISFDGRYVAFVSGATNLVANDTNARDDIFVRDTCAGTASCAPSTSRISVATGGGEANAHSAAPSVSGDGRYVAFVSGATSLVPGDANGVEDVFVRDTCAGAVGPCTPATVLVSVAADGSQGLLASDQPSISRDGRFVAFITASILALPDVNGVADAFVHDTCVGVATGCSPSTIRASAIADTRGSGQLKNSGVARASIGHDGRFVAIISTFRANGLNSARYEVLVVDACANAPGCSYDAVLADSHSTSVGEVGLSGRALSDDARIVTYVLSKGSLVWFADTCIGAPPGCVASPVQVSRIPLTSGVVSALSATGRFIVFTDVPGKTGSDIVVHDNCFGAPAGCFFSSVSYSDSPGYSPTIDGPGRAVVFGSCASNLVPGDTNAKCDLFLALTGR